jgi:hypothetical protein
LEAAAMAENFMGTDEKLGKDGKRRFNFTLGRHSHHRERAQQAWILSLALSVQISPVGVGQLALLPKPG